MDRPPPGSKFRRRQLHYPALVDEHRAAVAPGNQLATGHAGWSDRSRSCRRLQPEFDGAVGEVADGVVESLPAGKERRAQRLFAEIAERRRAREVRLADDLRRINAEYDAEVRGVRGHIDWQLRLHALFWVLCAVGVVMVSFW